MDDRIPIPKPETTKSGNAGGGGKGMGGSFLEPEYGTRHMKAYPLTEDQLENLFGIDVLAAVCFSIASALLSFSFNVQTSLVILTNIPPDKLGYWEALRSISGILSIFMFFAGWGFVRYRKNKLAKLKSRMSFPSDE